MGKCFEEITSELAAWLGQQKMFFVATAPLSATGLVNTSPKGMDTFRILGPTEVGYLDLTGSGVETIAHLNENARIVLMFCAFTGPPRIVRLHGRGTVVAAHSAEFNTLRQHFPEIPGARSVVHVALSRISDSCGYAVPRYEHVGDRDTLVRWATSKGSAGLEAYRAETNIKSIDGLPGLEVHRE